VGEGEFRLRTLARQTLEIFAQSKPSSQDPIPGVGGQAFYMSDAAYARRGDVGVEVVDFNSKDIEPASEECGREIATEPALTDVRLRPRRGYHTLGLSKAR
jgi:hypothetical protein